MRITETSVSTNLLQHLHRLSLGQSRLQESLATGQRVVRAEDDPAAVRRVIDLQTEASNLLRFRKNIAAASDISQAAFAAIDSLKDISDRAGEIAIAAEGAAGEGANQAHAREVDQMIEQALLTANGRSGGEPLFGGTVTGRAPFRAERDAAGRVVSVEYSGGEEQRKIPVGEGATIPVHTTSEASRELALFLNSLVELRNDLQDARSPSATGNREALMRSEDGLVRLIGKIGATQLRLESLDKQAGSRLVAIEENVSRETDSDMVETIVRFNQMQQVYQAALQSSGRLFSQSLLDFI